MRIFSLTVLSIAILACGEVSDEPMMGSGGSGGGPGRVRDSGVPRPDVRTPPVRMDMGTQQMDGSTGGSMGEPELVFIADDYVPYGTCPQDVEFVGQIQGGGAAIQMGERLGSPLTPLSMIADCRV